MASFIEQSLNKNETLIQTFRFHWSAWITFWLFLILAPFTLGISLIFALFSFITLKTTERGVTSRRVIQKRGFISRKTDEMKLSAVETVEIEQGILGRILGSGSIKVTGRGISNVVLKGLDDPMAVKRSIEEAEDFETTAAAEASS